MRLFALGFIVLCTLSHKARAFSLEVKAGPPGVGAGGTNPVGIPPSAADLEFSWVTENRWQYTLAVVPGLLMGKRYYHGDFYGGVGGGLLFSINGGGLGAYTALGYRSHTKEGLKFLAEFKQSLGIGEKILSPYALRMGAGYDF